MSILHLKNMFLIIKKIHKNHVSNLKGKICKLKALKLFSKLAVSYLKLFKGSLEYLIFLKVHGEMLLDLFLTFKGNCRFFSGLCNKLKGLKFRYFSLEVRFSYLSI